MSNKTVNDEMQNIMFTITEYERGEGKNLRDKRSHWVKATFPAEGAGNGLFWNAFLKKHGTCR